MKLRLLATALCLFAIAGALNAQTLASAKPPGYPLAAKAAGIEGHVVLKATISKEGKVQDIHVVSGPPELREAAINAVQYWTYKPYTHFGRVVEVDTTVTVNFTMGNPKEKAKAQAEAQALLAKSTQPSQDAQQTSTPQN
ncbi:TonB family C-terminal domain-containing protein [Granulicella pectinivorans]|uniref:TonB family C-terminal domain-containing protein n=1 Tax=Granulicella pectinivorans TaxID=474950 RepID=A0A1I6LCM7_9BACT|nr:energy transducer TonB [Granulicella pectinivorans]SFS01222.1 TonB family C-terminal domain-containing protein [Granulicella pectinivorans]